jgi:hypothetical protein
MDMEWGISQYGSHTLEMKSNLSHVLVDSFSEFQSEIIQIGYSNSANEQFNKKWKEKVFL